MPDGMENPQEKQNPESLSGAPLDGVRATWQAPDRQTDVSEAADPTRQKRILFLILGCGGVLLLFAFVFGFFLMVSLPASDGGGQGLKLTGNVLYASTTLLGFAALGFLAVRLLRSGLNPNQLPQALLRPGILVLILSGFSGMVLLIINQQTPLPIDILEPPNTQNLTAPVSITFGTETLRSILRNQNLKPLKYKWDFDGNGAVDAETTEHEVTTSYKSKGVFRVSLLMQLSNGDIRRTSTVVSVPRAVFDSTPVSPVLDQEVIFDLTNLVAKPDTVALVLWDFNGDGVQDSQGAGLSVTHTFSEIGSYQVEATVQYQGGLQEKYVRPVTILAEQKQPFRIMIETEGDLQGSAPLGIVFSVTVETGVNTSSIEWTFKNTKGVTQQTEIREGQRVSYVFQKDGEYRASVAVKDVRGRMATKSVRINVLNPLQLPDVRISGIPKPNRNIVEGVSPLEVKLESSTNTPFITFRWEQENASEVFRQQETYHAIYDKEGTFQVVLIATDDQGRSQKFPMEIRVLPPRSRVEFTALPSTGIAPLTVSFDASQSTVPDGRITGFSWTFGDGGREEQPQLLGAKVSHRYEEEGTFVVVVRALTEDGRSFEARKTIVVRSPTLDACIFPSRVSGIAPMGVRFDASCSTGKIEKYLWNYGDGKTNEQAVATQDYVFMQPGTYKVRLEVRNGQGGVSEETVTITVRSQ